MSVKTEFKKTEDLTRFKEGRPNVGIEEVQKEYFQVTINGLIIGVFHLGQVRQMLGDFDNFIP